MGAANDLEDVDCNEDALVILLVLVVERECLKEEDGDSDGEEAVTVDAVTWVR